MLRRAAAPVLGSLLTAVAISATGCVQKQTVPFEPKRIQLDEVQASNDRVLLRAEPISPLPRTEQDFLDVRGISEDELERGSDVLMNERYRLPGSDPASDPTTQPGGDSTDDLLPSTRPVDIDELGSVDFVQSGNEALLKPMSLREAVAKTVLHGYDVSVAAYQPAIEETRITEAEANFDTIFRQSLEYNYTSNQIGGFGVNSLEGFGIIAEDTQQSVQVQSTLQKLLRSGGQAELTFRYVYLDNDNAVLLNQSQFNPTHETALTLRFTQPLLRDFGNDVNEARIVINKNNQRISLLDFRETLEEAMFNTEQAYWSLWAAQQAVQIQKEQLDETLDTLRRISGRAGEDVDNGQQAQAIEQVFLRRQALIQAESQWKQLNIQFKAQVNDPDLPIAGVNYIQPVTDPLEQPLRFDLTEALETALLYRTEIGQQLLRVQSTRTALQVGRSNVLPRLDLVLSGGLQGLDNSFEEALINQFTFDGPNVAAGLQLEIPLGNRAARAVLRRALLQEQQAIEQYGQLVNVITSDVLVSMTQMMSSYEVLRESRAARAAAAERVRVYNGQAERIDQLGPEFSDLQLRALAILADARVQEAQAIAAYNTAILQYQRSKGTLLRYNNVILKEAAEPFIVNEELRRLLQPGN